MPYGITPSVNATASQSPTGFWPSLFGVQSTPNGFLSSLGHSINSGVGGILNMFGARPSVAGSPTTVAPGTTGTTTGGIVTPSNNVVQVRPHSLMHTEGMPAFAAALHAELLRKNQL